MQLIKFLYFEANVNTYLFLIFIKTLFSYVLMVNFVFVISLHLVQFIALFFFCLMSLLANKSKTKKLMWFIVWKNKKIPFYQYYICLTFLTFKT